MMWSSESPAVLEANSGCVGRLEADGCPGGAPISARLQAPGLCSPLSSSQQPHFAGEDSKVRALCWTQGHGRRGWSPLQFGMTPTPALLPLLGLSPPDLGATVWARCLSGVLWLPLAAAGISWDRGGSSNHNLEGSGGWRWGHMGVAQPWPATLPHPRNVPSAGAWVSVSASFESSVWPAARIQKTDALVVPSQTLPSGEKL